MWSNCLSKNPEFNDTSRLLSEQMTFDRILVNNTMSTLVKLVSEELANQNDYIKYNHNALMVLINHFRKETMRVFSRYLSSPTE